MRHIMFALTLAALSASAAHAQTPPADYVFNVPVRIENAAPLNGASVAVECSVQAYNASGSAIAVPRSRQVITVGPSGYHDTLHFEIALPEGVRRQDVVRWNCYMDISQARNRSGAMTPLSGPNAGAHIDQYPIVTGQAVRSSNIISQAEFPRPH